MASIIIARTNYKSAWLALAVFLFGALCPPILLFLGQYSDIARSIISAKGFFISLVVSPLALFWVVRLIPRVFSQNGVAVWIDNERLNSIFWSPPIELRGMNLSIDDGIVKKLIISSNSSKSYINQPSIKEDLSGVKSIIEGEILRIHL